MHHPRQDSIYHCFFYYTSRVALAGMKKAKWADALPRSYVSLAYTVKWCVLMLKTLRSEMLCINVKTLCSEMLCIIVKNTTQWNAVY